MKRSDFIKAIGLSTSGLLLPNSYLTGKTVKIYDNYIKGLAHYNFSKIKTSIKKGDELILIRESRNLYDSFAIQVCFNEYKIGYISAYENIVLANMLDVGVNLLAFVSQKDLKRSIYESLAIEIYAELVIPTQKLIDNMLAENRANDVNDLYRKGHF